MRQKPLSPLERSQSASVIRTKAKMTVINPAEYIITLHSNTHSIEFSLNKKLTKPIIPTGIPIDVPATNSAMKKLKNSSGKSFINANNG